METKSFPSLALPSSLYHPNYHHRGLYRPIYVNTKKGLENISQVFSFYGWLTINSKSDPSKVQASTSLGKIKWLPFWIGYSFPSTVSLP